MRILLTLVDISIHQRTVLCACCTCHSCGCVRLRCTRQVHRGLRSEADGQRALRVQVCIAGKASQASLLAMHAYRDQEEFRAKTGLKHARLLTHKEVDTQVHVAWLEVRCAPFSTRINRVLLLQFDQCCVSICTLTARASARPCMHSAHRTAVSRRSQLHWPMRSGSQLSPHCYDPLWWLASPSFNVVYAVVSGLIGPRWRAGRHCRLCVPRHRELPGRKGGRGLSHEEDRVDDAPLPQRPRPQGYAPRDPPRH